jgi:hypothetical protein
MLTAVSQSNCNERVTTMNAPQESLQEPLFANQPGNIADLLAFAPLEDGTQTAFFGIKYQNSWLCSSLRLLIKKTPIHLEPSVRRGGCASFYSSGVRIRFVTVRNQIHRQCVDRVS